MELISGAFRPLAEDLVHRQQQDHLQHRRQAARGGVDAAVLVELHLLLGDLGPVALVLGLDGLQLRLQHLHAPLGHDLRPEDRDHQHADDDRQQDDGDADVAGDAVQERQADEDDLEDRGECPRQQAQRVGAVRLRRTQVGIGRGGGVGVRRGVRVGRRPGCAWVLGRRGAWHERGRRRGVGRRRAGGASVATGAAEPSGRGEPSGPREPSAAGRGQPPTGWPPSRAWAGLRGSCPARKPVRQPCSGRSSRWLWPPAGPGAPVGKVPRGRIGCASLHRVIAAGTPGTAAGDALGTHPAALREPVLLDGLLRVLRAGWFIPARAGEEAEKASCDRRG